MSPQTRALADRRLAPFLFFAFFISGMAALIAETIWTRSLLLSLGTTATAVGVVLAAFMGGMGIGAAWVARNPRVLNAKPLAAFAIFEAFTGAYVLFSPALLSVAGRVPSLTGQYIAAIITLLPATMAMGATLPLLSRALRFQPGHSGSLVGALYGANTTGAVIGPIASVFVLFPLFGLPKTLMVASSLFFVSAAIGYVLHRLTEDIALDPPVVGNTDTLVEHQSSPSSTLVGLALAVSGASAMVYQVVWSRLLSGVFGSSVYGVSLTLSAFLLGLAGGSFGASWWIRRRKTDAPLLSVARAMIASAGFAFLSLLVVRSLPFLFLNLYSSFEGSPGALFFSQFLVASVLMLPATLALGAMFPLAVASLTPAQLGSKQSEQSSEDLQALQKTVGRIYSFNLVGSMLGAIAGSTLLVASLGVEFSLRISAILALFIALVLVVKASRFSVLSASVTTTFALIILALDPSGEQVVKSFGMYAEADVYASFEPRQLRQTMAAHNLLFYRDGPTASVAVQQIDRYKLLKINGKTDASNGPGDLETQLLLAHLPMLFHSAKDAAVIGWGSGTTVGALTNYDLDRIDAFEIEPAVVEASKFFEPENGKPLEDERLALHLGDARQLLSRSTANYDLIISEPSNPWLTGVANLFTQEFFQLLDARLNENGIVCQWFHLYGMTESSTQSVVATFQSVFPHVIAFGDRDLILLGAHQPIHLSAARLERLFQDPKLGPSFADAGLSYPADTLVNLKLDEDGALRFAEGATINTDQNLYLELSAPKSLYGDHVGSIRASMLSEPPDRIHLLRDETGAVMRDPAFELELAASLFTAQRLSDALRHTERSLELAESFDAYKLHGQILDQMGRPRQAREALEAALAIGGEPSARRFVEAMIRALDPPTGG